ncbi:MAG TPA: winged helix-turn-helix domain-containing protein, partial [Acidobacteriota bacterium]|nr:winged helix-turn-helix domain-containing protein [Acidobacteriota bacterium]
MLLEEPFTEIYKFGDFRLEVAERRLFRNGEPVLLTPKAFDVLVILVRNDGKLVTKQELLNQVWPNMVVEEANLANNISLLRKTLGSIPTDEPLIETVPRHGYRFRGNATLVSQPLPPRPFMIERYTVMEVQTEEIETPTGESEVFPVIDLPPDSPDPRVSEPGKTRDFIPASPAPKLIESPDQSGTTSGTKAGKGLRLYRWPLVTLFGVILVSFGY